MDRDDSSGTGLKSGRRKGIPMDSALTARFEPLHSGNDLPLLCRPVAEGMSLAGWARGRRGDIEQHLHRHGAILFRGFDMTDLRNFNSSVDVISGGAVPYLFRASPRTQIDQQFNIYTSTDYPAGEKIFPHNEHAYSPVFPLHLYFHCQIPATGGGQTPLIGTRSVMARIRPDVLGAFRSRRVLYVRNFGEGLGLHWHTVFQTRERSEVDAYCRSVGIETEWRSGDRLRTRQVSPAIVRHPMTQEPLWFNHVTFFNARSLPERARAGLTERYGPYDLPQNTFYGDGGEIEPEVIEHLRRIYLDGLTSFEWRSGDVLLLDNMLTAHARNSFVGPRRILTAMARPQNSADLVQESTDHGRF
jgi:alpha-ketoglutarate-dependent taurine dioxygenase